MSVYEPSLDPTSPSYAPFAYLELHPLESVRIQRAEDAAKAEAVRIAAGNKLLAKLREQDRASTGETVLTTDVVAHEKYAGEPVIDLEIDEPVRIRRKK